MAIAVHNGVGGRVGSPHVGEAQDKVVQGFSRGMGSFAGGDLPSTDYISKISLNASHGKKNLDAVTYIGLKPEDGVEV
jgi:hypothetical protein